MKKEWGALHTFAVAFLVGIVLVTVMIVSDNLHPKADHTRSAQLTDGSAGGWSDKVASFLYSPGELHAAHFKSEINCQNCHTPGQPVQSEYCVSCHSKADFTANSPQEVVKDAHLVFIDGVTCFTCHTEHRGLAGNISVPLDLAGHKLKLDDKLQKDCQQCHISDYKQAHRDMVNKTCEDCHKLSEPFSFKAHTFRHTDIQKLHIDPASKAFVKLPYPEHGECEQCHEPQFHVGEKGVSTTTPGSIDADGFDCLSCHNFNMREVINGDT